MPKPAKYWEDLLAEATRHRAMLVRSYFEPYAALERKPSRWWKGRDGRWRKDRYYDHTRLDWARRQKTKRWLLRTLQKLDHRIKHCEERIAARRTVWDLVRRGGREAARERAARCTPDSQR